MSTKLSADNTFEGFKFKLIKSNNILNIVNVDEIITDFDTMDIGNPIGNGMKTKINTGTVNLSIKCHCLNNQLKQVDNFILKQGYLFVAPEIPPICGYFTEYNTSTFITDYTKLDLTFIGSMQWLKDKVDEAKGEEVKITTKKENRKKRTLKRKLSF